MAVSNQALEFRKKSNSKREKIFRQRAKKVLVPFLSEFSMRNADAKTNPDVNIILEDVIKSIRNDKSLTEGTILFRDEKEFFELLLREVA